MKSQQDPWAIIYVNKENKFKYLNVKYIRDSDFGVFAENETEGAEKVHFYLSSDGIFEKCQVLKVYGGLIVTSTVYMKQILKKYSSFIETLKRLEQDEKGKKNHLIVPKIKNDVKVIKKIYLEIKFLRK